MNIEDQRLPVGPLDRVGLIKDLSPEQIPDGGMQATQDVRLLNGRLMALYGYAKFVSTVLQSSDGRVMHGTELLTEELSRFLFVTTLTKSYYYNTGTGAFVDIQDSSFTGTASDIFSTDTAYGYLVIANGIDAARKWSGSGAISTLGGMTDCEPGSITCIPKILRSFADFVIALNNEEGGNQIPTGVRWNKKGVLETWKNDAVTGAGQAGSAELNDTPAEIMNGVQLNNFLVIYKEDSIYLMSYVGVPVIFNFTKVVTTRGLLASRAVANMGAYHYFLSDDDFYMFDGYNLRGIGAGIKDFFFNDVHPEYRKRVQAVVFKLYGEIWWAYPSTESSGDFDKVLIYSYRTNTWTIALLDDATSLFFYLRQNDLTWATVPDLTWEEQTQRWNDVQFFTSTQALLFGTSDSYIMRHGLIYTKDGAAYTKSATTKLHDCNKPGVIKRLKSVQFACDAPALTNMQVYVGSCNNPGDDITWSAAFDLVTGHGAPKIDVDISAIYFCLKFSSVGSNDPWQVAGYQLITEGEAMQ